MEVTQQPQAAASSSNGMVQQPLPQTAQQQKQCSQPAVAGCMCDGLHAAAAAAAVMMQR